jgi:Cd2+/Zn2+-exporting ATPase/Cu+-exporting ATPase
MLASIGASAKRGLLIKGGKYLELLAKADVILLDKTGTLTLGQPQITDVVALNGKTQSEVLALAAAAERYSEHPLAAAVREAGRIQGLASLNPDEFVALPGLGIRAQVANSSIAVGSHRLLSIPVEAPAVDALTWQGKSLLYVLENEIPVGVLAAADTIRPEVPEAVRALQQLGIQHIELLTGDHERTAATLAQEIGISYQANLLPEDKVAVIKLYQSKGHTVVMVGDGVNDAPALAQADVGIAMGAAGTDIALEASHIALMRDDWRLVPEAFVIARRTLGVVKMNFGFTILYNTLGLLLAAFGILPPVLAAVAQSLPDLGILANSSRLLRQRTR